MKKIRTVAVTGAALALLAGGVAPAGAVAPVPSTTAAAVERFAANDAPVRVRVGAAHQVLTVTAISTTPVEEVLAGVFDRRDELVAYGESLSPVAGRPKVHKVPVDLFAEDLTGWGKMEWELVGFRDGDDEPDVLSVVPTDVRAHSMLGLSAGREGGSVTVRGAARAYVTTVDRYAAWSGRPVSIQRWDGKAWREVGRATTDRGGGLTATVAAPKGSQLRLVTADTTAIWGATSKPVTV